jgi:sigma-B regulation protein RsbU (phosphoserine phosphatase)
MGRYSLKAYTARPLLHNPFRRPPVMTLTAPVVSSHPFHSHQDNSWSYDLEAARRVQQRLFPQQLPQPDGWDVAAAFRPARVVAGDYLDLFWLGTDHLALALGDVAGKGLGPALVMAGLRALVRSRLPRQVCDLAGLMEELNDYLLDSTPDDLFVTLFLGVLEAPTGLLRYANAGHLPPLVLAGPADGDALQISDRGTVLGMFPSAEFGEGRVRMKLSCLLALFSDGVTEATDRAGKMFHQRRVVEELQGAWKTSSEGMLTHLLGSLERFTQGKEQEDDISLILLRRLG